LFEKKSGFDGNNAGDFPGIAPISGDGAIDPRESDWCRRADGLFSRDGAVRQRETGMARDQWMAALVLAVLPGFGQAGVVETSAGPMDITQIAGGLDEPWGIAFLPDGSFLVTERAGHLWLYTPDGATRREVAGMPEVYLEGQGGLLDVMVPRDFATSRVVWLTYAQPQGAGAGTALARVRLADGGGQLEGLETVFAAPIGGEGGRHFGSRVVEAADGSLFVTLGDRGTGPDGQEAQDPMRAEGKVIHLNADGSPATAMPGFLPGVYSLGHRNPQGAAMDGSGQLWVVEHGAQGGDELNHVLQGHNYGWPVIAYGEQYGGGQIGVGTAAPGMDQPEIYWDPSMAPSGLMFYDGALVPDWQGDAFVGSLKFDYLGRLDAENSFAEERISTPETARVRAVVTAPDGAIWFLSVNNGAIYRMAPAK
jgi:aldose sugar dehydrogenase